MWKKELRKNKIFALLLLTLGVASVFIDYDASFLIFTMMVAIPLFLSRKNRIE